jgi:hypothetical protein
MASRKQAPQVRFSQELFDEICRRLASGGDENCLRKICAEKGMPDRGTVVDWSRRTPELRAQYEKAFLDRRDTYFDELIEIADTETDPQRARNRIDARKWAWARQDRARFGDKLGVDGGTDGAPVQVQIVRFGASDAEDSNPE